MLFTLAACKTANPAPTPTSAPTATIEPVFNVQPTAAPLPTINLDGSVTTDSGLQYLEEVKGTGAALKEGDLINMNFIARLSDGTELVNTFTDGKLVTVMQDWIETKPGLHHSWKTMILSEAGVFA